MPTGLYGQVQANRRRSLLLFVMFVVAFQLLALTGLAIGLLLFDPAHAPIAHPAAYVRRYVPLLFVLAAILFAAQMWWFVGNVRKRTGFRYVDSHDEPRLCGIVEPLAIAAGIATPFVAVIERPSRNAFACGVQRNHMVVVATRGLIDGLDDDELAAVLANLVIHIRNRDTRLLAAASVFMGNMLLIQRERGVRVNHWIQGVLFVAFPVTIPLALLFGFLIAMSFRLGYASRALIGASRELIADAEAVRLTHRPAALAAALNRIADHDDSAGFGEERAAMLFFGPTEGPLATHPSVSERLGALARTTGSMLFDPADRLDTRPAELRTEQAPAYHHDPELERIAVLAKAPQRRGFWRAFRSVRDPGRNLAGLTPRGTLIVAVSLAAVAIVYHDTLRGPHPLRALFNPAAVETLSGAGQVLVKCTIRLHPSAEVDEECERLALDFKRREDAVTPHLGPKRDPDAYLTQREKARRATIADVARGCFAGRWDANAGTTSAPPNPLNVYLAFGPAGAAPLAAVAPGAERDRRLIDYAQTRLLLIDNSLHFYGEPGLAAFNAAVDRPDHQAALAALAERVRSGDFLRAQSAADQASIILLARQGPALRPCALR
ncbi:MAG: M48 family metalloprotease [Sphingomicrobium sp.]